MAFTHPPAVNIPPNQLPPKRPNWQRWRRQARGKISLLRSLEYEAIGGITLAGKTLDLGGGETTEYLPMARVNGTVETVNRDEALRPTYRSDLNDPLPLPAASFDHVICFNTLEHVRRDEAAISEGLRVLKPGGSFHFLIPFLYRVHGSPVDLHRHAAWWWHDTLTALGIPSKNFMIEPLVWDPWSSALAIINFSNRPWLRYLILAIGVLRHGRGKSARLNHHHFSQFALGYYVAGTKGEPLPATRP